MTTQINDKRRNEMSNEVKFPDVTVQLVGRDGNAFAVLGAAKRALAKAGHRDMVDEYLTEAMSDDYDHLLATTMRWMNVS